jgi:hypothetical protein
MQAMIEQRIASATIIGLLKFFFGIFAKELSLVLSMSLPFKTSFSASDSI